MRGDGVGGHRMATYLTMCFSSAVRYIPMYRIHCIQIQYILIKYILIQYINTYTQFDHRPPTILNNNEASNNNKKYKF